MQLPMLVFDFVERRVTIGGTEDPEAARAIENVTRERPGVIYATTAGGSAGS